MSQRNRLSDDHLELIHRGTGFKGLEGHDGQTIPSLQGVVILTKIQVAHLSAATNQLQSNLIGCAS
jgi:hypothetical protein